MQRQLDTLVKERIEDKKARVLLEQEVIQLQGQVKLLQPKQVSIKNIDKPGANTGNKLSCPAALQNGANNLTTQLMTYLNEMEHWLAQGPISSHLYDNNQ